jgi:hypothetical protein
MCLSREPSPAEEARLAEFIAEQHSFYAAHQTLAAKPPVQPAKLAVSIAMLRSTASVSPVELAAWSAGARVLLNLDEFITRE